MDMHLSTEEIKSYLARKLTEQDFDKASDHVHSCAVCYQDFLTELQKRFPIVIDLDELAGMQGWHLEGEELAAFVEGRSDELDFECASIHLEECSSCMEKASTAFEFTLENHRSKKVASTELSFLWKSRLPGFQSNSMSRLRLAAAALLLVAVTLIAWSVLKPPSEKSQLAGAGPSENISPDPSQQPTLPNELAPDIGGKTDELNPDPLSGPQSEKAEVERYEDEIERALIAKNLTMPPVIELLDRTPEVAVRGNLSLNQSFRIISPFATVIKNNRATFRWTELSGATTYTVSVFDAALHLIRTSEPLKETQWLMPESLEAGIVFTWTVTALKDGQELVAPAPPARAEFKILGKPELVKLKRLISRSKSHATRGVLYAENGLLDDAEREFRTHLTLSPADDRAKTLLETVESWRRLRPYRAPSPDITKRAH